MINKSQNEGEASCDEEPGKLFIGGLSWETTEEKLQQYFGEFGEVIDSTVMKNTESGQSRGFGFVTFADPSCVQTVLTKGPHLLDGRAIDPKPCSTKAAIKSKKNSQYPKVFLGGLPFNVTETDLRSIFSRFGEVMDVIIMYDHEKNKCRGFGFLSFEKDEEINKCVAEHYVFVNGKKVEVKRAEPRDGRPSSSNQWSNMPNSSNVDPSRNASMQNYQWGATPPAGYGYGAPGPVPYGSWGAPPPQWGPGYPAPGYPPYGAPPYGNWNWNVQPPTAPGVPPLTAPVPVPPTNGAAPTATTADQYTRSHSAVAPPPPQSSAAPPPSTKQDYSNFSGYANYTQDSGYSVGTARSTTYPMDPNAQPAADNYSNAPGPQRNNQSQQGYHPYRRV